MAEHKFQALGPHILIMHPEQETDRPVLAAIIGEKRTLLMDSGNSSAHAVLFRDELDRRGIRRPDLLVLTHWHWDHSFGMSAWEVPVLAHVGTAEVLAGLTGREWTDESMAGLIVAGTISEESAAHIGLEYGDARAVTVVKPDVTFTGTIAIDLGGVTCELTHVGGDHSADSCILYIKEERVLFLGDALGPAVYGGPRRYNSRNFLKLMDQVNAYDAQCYVESHGLPMSTQEFRDDLAPWVQLARTVETFGDNREQVIQELKARLQTEELSGDLLRGVEYFIAGMKQA